MNGMHCPWLSLAALSSTLESSAFSVLWATRTMLSTLIRMLPQDTLGYTLVREYHTGIAETFRTEVIVRNHCSPQLALLVPNLMLGHREGPSEGELE